MKHSIARRKTSNLAIAYLGSILCGSDEEVTPPERCRLCGVFSASPTRLERKQTQVAEEARAHSPHMPHVCYRPLHKGPAFYECL